MDGDIATNVRESIDWIVSEGHARSYYYVRESPRGPVETWALNYLLGQKLRLNFRSDSLDQVVATGGHRGVYRSEQVRVEGPRQVPSEPIPLPDESPTAAAAPPDGGAGPARPRRAPSPGQAG